MVLIVAKSSNNSSSVCHNTIHRGDSEKFLGLGGAGELGGADRGGGAVQAGLALHHGRLLGAGQGGGEGRSRGGRLSVGQFCGHKGF